MKRILTFILLFVFVSATTFAQEFEKQNVDRNGNPTFVKFDTKVQSASKSETKAVLSSLFNMTSNDEYKTIRSEKDQIGFTHERFQQYCKGIKVEHGVYVVHSRNEVIESMSGEYKLINNINVTPSVSSVKAVENAKAFINAQEYMQEDNAPELVIIGADYGKHSKDVHEMVLAYKVNVYAAKPLSRDYVYVNAHTGEIVSINAIIKTANATGSADTRYSGTKTINTDSYNSSYRLRDYTRGNGIITYNCNEGTSYTSAVDFTDANNSWTAAEYDNSDKDNGALDAHWAGMMTYDYFSDVHNRNSFDGNNALMKTYVHFDSNYDNAYWNGSVFTFGDGSSFDILTSLDVFGHEFGHAVCSYTADLVYSREPGALNEAFSDIWGCAIEYKYAPTKDTWLMGEDLGTALRSISDPKSKGLPDTYLGTNWVTSSSDYYGVHTNNGPFCYWFYLISEGGSGTNDNSDAYSVTAIGIEKAEQITYRIESVYMTTSSDYEDARTYAIQSAQDLYGIDSQEEICVTNAMHAVGVGDAYGTPSPAATYCESLGSNFSYEWIAKVELGSFSKTSTGAAYSDFTSSTINVDAGATYAVTLTPGYASTTYDEYWKIWIGFNNDTIFDANELVYDAGALSKVAVSGNITIQSGISGVRRMRVSMKYNAEQTACETFSYGEVEDYNITIGGGTPDTQAPTAPTNLSSSNITETSLTLSWTASTDNVGVTAYDVYQDGSLLGSVTGTSGDITGLTAATTYAYYVKAKDAATNVSSASSTLNVTTSSTVATTDLTLTITFDNYPEETSWTLKTSGGTSVASGGTYASQADGSTLVIPINDLDDDCYVFTMLDAYGDGMCCSYGSGSYALKVTGGATIASGGSFTSSDVTNFCIPYTSFNFAATTNSIDNVITKPAVNVYPNPASSFITVQVTNAKANGMISIYSATGALVKLVEMDESEREVDITELPSGLYLITVDTKKEAITKQFIKK
ncbi:MAG: T9SS type A sorting domain-containing protein [Bacteroidales bacterium]|nr:T9SS type A sorting domain-containing protein [Bacteroidales bacterium]